MTKAICSARYEQMQKEILTPLAPGKADLWQTLRQGILGPKETGDLRLNLEIPRLITAPNSRSGRSEPLEDFRTSAENAAMADFLLEQIRGFVETPDVQLITSIIYCPPGVVFWSWAGAGIAFAFRRFAFRRCQC
jgi:CRISPR-associated protein (TIGR02584 family)